MGQECRADEVPCMTNPHRHARATYNKDLSFAVHSLRRAWFFQTPINTSNTNRQDQTTTRANAPTGFGFEHVDAWFTEESLQDTNSYAKQKHSSPELDKLGNCQNFSLRERYFTLVLVMSVGLASGRVFSRHVQDAIGVDIEKST